jgi:AraC-like DNA-binding protein
MRSLRLQRAADLLKQNAGSVSEICFNLGFNDHTYFSRAFKKTVWIQPRRIQKRKFVALLLKESPNDPKVLINA